MLCVIDADQTSIALHSDAVSSPAVKEKDIKPGGFRRDVLTNWTPSFHIWFWRRQFAPGQSTNFASCRGGRGKRSCPMSATEIHSVGRTPNLSIEGRTLCHWIIAAVREPLQGIASVTRFKTTHRVVISTTFEWLEC